MVVWQKKVQKIIRELGKEFDYISKANEENFYVSTKKPYTDYNDKRKIPHYAIRPDVIWRKKEKIKYNFEIEEKEDKWLIGTIINGLMFSIQEKSQFVLIVKEKKQAEWSWDFIDIVSEKLNIKENYPNLLPMVYHFEDKSSKALMEKIKLEFKEWKM